MTVETEMVQGFPAMLTVGPECFRVWGSGVKGFRVLGVWVQALLGDALKTKLARRS